MKKIVALGLIVALSSSLYAGYYYHRDSGDAAILGFSLLGAQMMNAAQQNNAIKAASKNEQESLRISLEQIDKVREATAKEFEKTEERFKKMSGYLRKLNKRLKKIEEKLGISLKEQGESDE